MVFRGGPSNAFALSHILDRVMVYTSVVPHLDASGKEDFTLAMAKRVLAGVTGEIEPRVLVNRASRLQASPFKARVLLGTAMVVGVRRARIGVSSKPAMAVLSNLD